jgi:hypothetical protein
MMKARFSAWLVLAGLLCFVPCALGQGSSSTAKMAQAGNGVLNYSIPGLLIFNHRVGHVDPDHGSACSNQNEDSRAWGGSSNCKSVPEGGTTFMYLALAGLCCLGAIAFGSHRPGLLAKQTS